MNYCRNCGMKIEPTYRICPSCGNALTQPIYQGIPTSKKTTGKDVTSFIFNIIAFYFAFVVYISMDELVLDCIANVGRINMAYAIGALLWQIVFGGAEYCTGHGGDFIIRIKNKPCFLFFGQP